MTKSIGYDRIIKNQSKRAREREQSAQEINSIRVFVAPVWLAAMRPNKTTTTTTAAKKKSESNKQLRFSLECQTNNWTKWKKTLVLFASFMFVYIDIGIALPRANGYFDRFYIVTIVRSLHRNENVKSVLSSGSVCRSHTHTHTTQLLHAN